MGKIKVDLLNNLENFLVWLDLKRKMYTPCQCSFVNLKSHYSTIVWTVHLVCQTEFVTPRNIHLSHRSIKFYVNLAMAVKITLLVG